MKARRILGRNSAKFLILLVILLTASVSAAVYYSMTMQPTVTIKANQMRFVQGNDWPAGSALGDNATWVRLSLSAYPNATMVYEQPLNVSNTNGSSTNQFRLRHVSITPVSGDAQVSNFTAIRFVVKNKAGVSQSPSFNYTTTGDNWSIPTTTSYFTVPAAEKWIIYVETQGAPSANTGKAVSIHIAVDVP